MKKIFRGVVRRASLVMDRDYTDYLLSLEGFEIDVTVEKHRNKRSLRQNAYYWKIVVGMIAEETGYSKDETHEILRSKFLSEEAKVGDDIIVYSKSTTSLKTSEFETLMTEIREWASVTLNILVPQPNEVEA